VFVPDDRLVRRLHERRIDDLRRSAETSRRNTLLASGRRQRSLRRVLGDSMVRLGSRLAADPNPVPARSREDGPAHRTGAMP
jgi:hypothetical protein